MEGALGGGLGRRHGEEADGTSRKDLVEGAVKRLRKSGELM